MCEYCEGNYPEPMFVGEISGLIVSLDIDKDLAIEHGDTTRYVSINYCPMCGRSLKEADHD